MSIKTLPNGPDRNSDSLLIFLILSLVIHAGVVFGLLSFGPVAGFVLNRIVPREKEPVVVDVVELPPRTSEKPQAPKKPSHFADRTQSVEKETYPEPSPLKPLRAAPKAPAPLKPLRDTAKAPSPLKPLPSVKERPVEAPKVKEPARAAQGLKDEEGAPLEKKDLEEVFKEAGSDPQKAEDTDKGPARPKEAAPVQKGKPSLFPTEERLAELEKKYEAEAPKGETGKTLQLNTAELRYQKYLMDMKKKIEFYWEYPEVAGRNGWQGTLRIDFSINKDGSIGSIKVVKSSNYPVLDDAAVTALRLAAPFPPFPANFVVEQLNIRGQFEYDIYRPAGR